jgi:hypothetical protein
MGSRGFISDGLAKVSKLVIASGALHRMVLRAERSNLAFCKSFDCMGLLVATLLAMT